MWPKEYRDYPEDTALKKQQIESGNGIIEMHELNGWGDSLHCDPKSRTPGFFRSSLQALFSLFGREEN